MGRFIGACLRGVQRTIFAADRQLDLVVRVYRTPLHRPFAPMPCRSPLVDFLPIAGLVYGAVMTSTMSHVAVGIAVLAIVVAGALVYVPGVKFLTNLSTSIALGIAAASLITAARIFG
jgi:hypothetical protein